MAGDPSDGLLMLRRPVERPVDSSLLIAALEVSRSLNALTVTGATDGVAAVGIAVFGIFVMLWLLAAVDFDAIMVVVEDALDGST
jgi:hypothetical protein